MAEIKSDSPKKDLGIPTWAKVLPLLGFGGGLYLAFKGKGNVGKHLVYGAIGIWATSVPLIHYSAKALSVKVESDIDSATKDKKDAPPILIPSPSPIPANEANIAKVK